MKTVTINHIQAQIDNAEHLTNIGRPDKAQRSFGTALTLAQQFIYQEKTTHGKSLAQIQREMASGLDTDTGQHRTTLDVGLSTHN